jgi:hypothetical protein
MTRSEAERRARLLQEQHPDRTTHRFLPRRSPDGSWHVAKLELPEPLGHPVLRPTIDASPQPSPADDPRSGHERRAPGIAGGL